MDNYESETKRLRGLVESCLAGCLPCGSRRPEAGALLEAMEYTLSSPGKRVRPILLILSCLAAGGKEEDALPFACAVEFIHNYSLIHDDLPAMDDDDLRRGRPTNHKVFGEAMAILAGDGLQSAAFELILSECKASIGDPDALRRRVLAGSAIAEGCGCGGMVAGQSADIEAEGKGASAELLEYIHANKTAALIKASALAGAWLGGAAPALAQYFAEYGENLGLAFQIADDILDFEGDASTGKASFPAVHGIDASRQRLSELTERAAAVAGAACDEGADVHYAGILQEMAGSLALRVK